MERQRCPKCDARTIILTLTSKSEKGELVDLQYCRSCRQIWVAGEDEGDSVEMEVKI